jgi:hypothetical protein
MHCAPTPFAVAFNLEVRNCSPFDFDGRLMALGIDRLASERSTERKSRQNHPVATEQHVPHCHLVDDGSEPAHEQEF